MTLNNAGEVLARLVCQGTDEFVFGQERVWYRPALQHQVKESITNDRVEVIRISNELQVSPSELQSDNDLIVADGFVFLRRRLVENVQAEAKDRLGKEGFVDETEVASKLSLNITTMRPVITEALKAFQLCSRQDYEVTRLKERLLKQLLEADEETVPIPAELRLWAAEAYRSHTSLQSGQFINMGSEYEPTKVRMRRAQQVRRALDEGRMISDSDARYLKEEEVKELIKVKSSFVSNAFLDLLVANIVKDKGCCREADLGTDADVINRAMNMLNDFVRLVDEETSESFIFNKKQLDAFMISDKDDDASFCSFPSAKEFLRRRKGRRAVVERRDDALSLNEKSKSELEAIFVSSLWPELILYVETTTKLKRTGLYPLLIRQLMQGAPKSYIVLLLERYLRIDLQLGPKRDIPESEYAEKIIPIQSENESGERLVKIIQTIASNKFGLSCLPLDKKREKDILLRIKAEWIGEARRKQSVRTRWLYIMRLVVLAAWKLVMFYSEDESTKDLWTEIQTIIAFPGDLVMWTNERFEYHDWEDHADYIDQLVTVDSFEPFLASCSKRAK